MIDPKKMTEKTQEALISSQQAAQEAGRSQLDVEELLASLLAQQGGIVPSVIEALGGSPPQLLAAIQQELARRPKVQGNVQLSASG
ncbi:MAG TPA: Clp protease N-terminal domain-containing protein, partial [Candidatus Limnocylindria bacterium]|nr:Clp protease N-terminal domain-containing protein [Candidatus Limnocylindria bacterium]